ncbi:RNA polymerase sigma factor [Aliikangiella marina]|uniref:RNA polymerase sigma factor n=1 Tax=Aliikangiella marina TaxID=1712262 RepID=A0A545TDB0_9GAMM|nr:RNA polymerase sigma factor [Aliikangiella marina]TQV75200.1 RNA polymerase sigma factor [Aliikangiella marina]
MLVKFDSSNRDFSQSERSICQHSVNSTANSQQAANTANATGGVALGNSGNKSESSQRTTTPPLSMEQFLAQVEKKAYRMAEIATQNQSDALDIVQDSMIKLVEKYAQKPASEWRPLFYRILQSRITDYFRRKTIQQKIFFWKSAQKEDDEIIDPVDQASDFITPEREISGQRNIDHVLVAIKQLPVRQQQCFMLRSWEGFSVSETALAMGCSEGSVKTHYSRAREALAKAVQETMI